MRMAPGEPVSGPGLSQTAWSVLNDLAKQRVMAQQPLRAINELEYGPIRG